MSSNDFDNSTASIDACRILSLLLQPPESRRLVLLMLGSSVAPPTRRALKIPVRKTSSIWGRRRKCLVNRAGGIRWNVT